MAWVTTTPVLTIEGNTLRDGVKMLVSIVKLIDKRFVRMMITVEVMLSSGSESDESSNEIGRWSRSKRFEGLENRLFGMVYEQITKV